MATNFNARFKGLVSPVAKWSGGYFTTRLTKDVIRSSIRNILHTRLGERVMLPEFGSRLHELVFEPLDDIMRQLARTYVIEALRRWERRITITDVKVVSDEDRHEFSVVVTYVINENAEEDTLTIEGFTRQI